MFTAGLCNSSTSSYLGLAHEIFKTKIITWHMVPVNSPLCLFTEGQNGQTSCLLRNK